VTREKWYTIREAAKFLGISTVTLRRYIKGHKINAYRIASRYRFKQEALEEFLEACRLGPHSETEITEHKKNPHLVDNPARIEQAEDLADEVLRDVPDQVRSLYIKALTASRLARYDEAEGYYRKILESRPRDSAAYLFLGLLYQEMQKRDRALEMWRQVVNIDRSSDLAEVARYHITRALRTK